jgi:hypothetical protein
MRRIPNKLFVLAMDTLGRLFKHATELGILRQLHPTTSILNISLYTDDVVLFCHPLPGEVEAVNEILKLLGHASGLSEFLQELGHAHQVLSGGRDTGGRALGCPIVKLPLKYLGIPLTIRRPTDAQLQPLVGRVAGDLPT